MGQKITRRMKWIVKQMRENDAIIKEHRDAFLEKSWYELTWGKHLEHSHEVTRKMLRQLTRAGLIECKENNPVYKYGEFVTSEGVFGLKEFKPISEIPSRLSCSGIDKDGYCVHFWVDDDEAGLHLFLLDEEISELKNKYGITDDLIDWMRDQEMYTVDWTIDGNDKISDYEQYLITDEIVARFYAT